MPSWVRTLRITALPADADPWAEAHLAHLRELRAQGRLRAAGAFPRGDGFLEIFEAADLLEAEETARASPLVTRGLAAWTLEEWRPLDV